MEIPEGAKFKIQFNRFDEDIDFFPSEDKDYIFQMKVAVDYITYNPSSKRYRITLKRVGEYGLLEI